MAKADDFQFFLTASLTASAARKLAARLIEHAEALEAAEQVAEQPAPAKKWPEVFSARLEYPLRAFCENNQIAWPPKPSDFQPHGMMKRLLQSQNIGKTVARELHAHCSAEGVEPDWRIR